MRWVVLWDVVAINSNNDPMEIQEHCGSQISLLGVKMENLNVRNKKTTILLIILMTIFMLSAVRAADDGKADKSGGGPFAFLQSIFTGFGGGGKEDSKTKK